MLVAIVRFAARLPKACHVFRRSTTPRQQRSGERGRGRGRRLETAALPTMSRGYHVCIDAQRSPLGISLAGVRVTRGHHASRVSSNAGWMRVRWSYRPTATTTWRPGPRSHTSRCPESCSTVKLDDEVGPVLGTAVARRQSEHLLDHRDAPSTSSTTTSGRGRITASTSAGGQGGRGPTQGARRERVPAASRSGAASASPGSGAHRDLVVTRKAHHAVLRARLATAVAASGGSVRGLSSGYPLRLCPA